MKSVTLQTSVEQLHSVVYNTELSTDVHNELQPRRCLWNTEHDHDVLPGGLRLSAEDFHRGFMP